MMTNLEWKFSEIEGNTYTLLETLIFYEQNNLSVFKQMFLEQVEFGMKEYF
jgi:hypothetical protein